MKNKNYILIVIGQVISLFGSSVQRFCLSLYLLDFTGSAAAFSNIMAISILPYIVCAPLAGWLSDHVSKKWIMVCLDLISGLTAAVYAVILFTGTDSVLIIGMVLFLLSLCSALYAPAVTTSIPLVVPADQLVSANGVVNQVSSLSNLLGPIIGGILYGLFSFKLIVLINCISFIAAAVMELFLVIREDNKTPSKLSIKNIFLETAESISYLKKEKPVVLRIIFTHGLYNVFLVPVFTILGPYLIKIVLEMSSQVFGISEGVIVLGMILGGFWISMKPKKFIINKMYKESFIMCISLFVMALAIGFFSDISILIVYSLSGMVIYMALTIWNVVSLTYMQQETKPEMLGKISAFSTAAATITVAPGQLLFGHFLDRLLPMVWLVAAAGLANLGVALFIRKNVKDL